MGAQATQESEVKFVVTTLLASMVALGAWTLKEVVELKVTVAEVRRDVSHLATRIGSSSQRADVRDLSNLSLDQLKQIETR